MGTRRGLGIHLIFVCVFLVANKYSCFGVGNVSVACSQKERLALLKFKGSVEDTSGMLSSWVGEDCCLWERIHCDSLTGTIDSLNLRGEYYFGGEGGPSYSEGYLVGNEVNSSLAELRHLKYLDLSLNFYQGSRIPEFIGSFKQLMYLNLSTAGFQAICCSIDHLSSSWLQQRIRDSSRIIGTCGSEGFNKRWRLKNVPRWKSNQSQQVANK